MLRKLVVTASVVSVGLVGATSAMAGDITAARTADGGCSVSGTADWSAGQAKTAQAYRVDLSSCTVAPASLPAGSSAAQASKSGSLTAAASGDVSAAATATIGHQLRVVNQNNFKEQQDVLHDTWSYNGNFVGGGRCSFRTTWYDPLWNYFHEGAFCRVTNDPVTGRSNGALGNEHDMHFLSPGPGFFCPSGGGTRVNIAHALFGRYNGAARAVWNVTASGACSNNGSLFIRQKFVR